MGKKKALGALLAVLLATSGAGAAEEKSVDWFDIGQQLARCSGHYMVAQTVATAIGKPAAAEHFANLHRGWLLAATFALQMARDAQPKPLGSPEEIARALSEARTTEILARIELGNDKTFGEVTLENNRACDPLTPIQVQIIQVLRRRAASATPQ